MTGLCTQVNNGILIDSSDLTAAYKTRWDALSKDGATYPPALAKAGSTPARGTIGKAKLTAWNVPCLKFVDLNDASKYISAAQEGVLKWLYNEWLQSRKDNTSAKKASPQYDGNFDDDTWQDWYTKGANLREIEFWLS